MGSIHNVTPSTKALIIKAAEGQTANLLEIQDNLGNTLYYIDKDGNPSTGQSGVVGPVSSTDEAIARFDGTTGAKIQDSKIIIDDNGSINIPTGQYYKKNGTALTYSDVDAASNSHNHDADYSAINHNHDATYAPIAKGVTNGDSHDHSGGDGAQIDHVDLSNVGTNTHAEIDTHLAASAPHAGHALSSHNHSATEITSGTLDGDRLPALSSTKKGGVPATGTPSGKYLKDSGEWDTPTGSGGDVVGPASATDHAICRYDSTTGKLIENSSSTIDDSGSINIPTGQTFKINGSAHTHTPSEVGLSNVTNNAQIKDPGSSVDEQILRWDGTTGDTVQACLLTVNDTGTANIPTGQTYNINGNPHTHTGLVTNGDSHDHSGGDGAQIDHTTLSNIGSNPHSTIDTHLGAASPHSGHAIGIASTTDNRVVRFDSTGGKQLQDSLMTIDDSGTPNIPNGQTYNINGSAHTHSETVAINCIIDGGGSAITTGQKGHLEIPFAMTITGWTILADQSGSIVVDVWKDSYANFPPTVADTIAGSEKPTLSSVQKNQDLSLTTWTTSISAGDILAFNVDSASTVTRVTIAIRGTRSV
jgi:hypothetical protein